VEDVIDRLKSLGCTQKDIDLILKLIEKSNAREIFIN